MDARLIIVGAITAPAAAFGAPGGLDVPGWMQRMMDDAPPEMERMMRAPEMEQMMRSPEMRRTMESRGVMDEMMRSAAMRAMMHGSSPEPAEDGSR